MTRTVSRRPWRCSLAALLLAACGTRATPDGAEPPDSAASDPNLQGEVDEAPLLAAAGPAVWREGGLLVIRPTGGPPIELRDDSSDVSEGYRIHRYDGRIERTAFHTVHLSLWESAAALLVHDSTGRVAVLAARPLPSPSGARLAVGQLDLEAQMMPNVLQLYRVDGDRLVEEYAVEPTDWGPAELAWVHEDTLALARMVVSSRGPGDYDRVPARLVRGARGWTLTDRSEQ
ncbi:MAG: hypothetical protein R2909_15250 [Gemmatimonadales bacterium]